MFAQTLSCSFALQTQHRQLQLSAGSWQAWHSLSPAHCMQTWKLRYFGAWGNYLRGPWSGVGFSLMPPPMCPCPALCSQLGSAVFLPTEHHRTSEQLPRQTSPLGEAQEKPLQARGWQRRRKWPDSVLFHLPSLPPESHLTRREEPAIPVQLLANARRLSAAARADKGDGMG